MIKAILTFTGFTDAALLPASMYILDSMAQNVTTFPAPTPLLADIQSRMDIYRAAFAVTVSGPSKSQTVAKKIARAALVNGLRDLGLYVNGVAKGDAMIVELSGFPRYDTVKTPPPSIRPAPQKVRLKHGRLIGTVEVRFRPHRREDAQEVQVNLGDPNDESGYVTKAVVRGGKAVPEGLPRGAMIWIRVRSVNAQGQPGACSDPAEIRVV